MLPVLGLNNELTDKDLSAHRVSKLELGICERYYSCVYLQETFYICEHKLKDRLVVLLGV